MDRRLVMPGIAVAIMLTGCASMSSTPAGTGDGSPAASAAATAAPSPSQQYCTTKACITHDLNQSLVGMVAQDESVSVKASCRQSTVKSYPDQVYSATCTVTYSDGSTATGTGNLLLGQQKVTFTPAGA